MLKYFYNNIRTFELGICLDLDWSNWMGLMTKKEQCFNLNSPRTCLAWCRLRSSSGARSISRSRCCRASSRCAPTCARWHASRPGRRRRGRCARRCALSRRRGVWKRSTNFERGFIKKQVSNYLRRANCTPWAFLEEVATALVDLLLIGFPGYHLSHEISAFLVEVAMMQG